MRSGLILAGGASQRFGRPKAFAEFRGRPMVAWVADALRPLCDEILVSIAKANVGAPFRALLPAARLVVDERPDRGPIEGLRLGLRAAAGDPVLVAPCDTPLLRTELYALLLERLGGREVAAPKLEALDPVRAVYRRAAVLRLLESEPVESPSSLVDRLDAVFVTAEDLRRADPDLRSFVDVNSLEDLARADETR